MSNLTGGMKEFIHLLETMADNKMVLGDRLVEVGVSGPNLEATISSVALAQAELGHARLLYNWAFDIKNGGGEKPDIKEQTGKAFQCGVKIDNWITLIAGMDVISHAIDVVLEAISSSGRQELASKLSKMVREEEEHIMFADGWAHLLLRDRGKIPHLFKEAMESARKEAEGWLQEVESNQQLKQERFIPENVQLVGQFRERLRFLEEEGVQVNVG